MTTPGSMTTFSSHGWLAQYLFGFTLTCFRFLVFGFLVLVFGFSIFFLERRSAEARSLPKGVFTACLLAGAGGAAHPPRFLRSLRDELGQACGMSYFHLAVAQKTGTNMEFLVSGTKD